MHSPVKLMVDRSGAIINIGDDTRIHGSCLHAWKSISIGQNYLIAANCQILHANGHELSFLVVTNRIKTSVQPKPIVIGSSDRIGAGTTKLPGSNIGQGSIIGAGSVVTGEIPANVIYAGNRGHVLAN
jgi:acetyltransferase-like isoleucine patch superfamily enzyme